MEQMYDSQGVPLGFLSLCHRPDLGIGVACLKRSGGRLGLCSCSHATATDHRDRQKGICKMNDLFIFLDSGTQPFVFTTLCVIQQRGLMLL